MASRTAIARSSRLFSSSRALTIAPRPQWQPAALRTGNVRMFTASSRVEIKKYTADHEWVELDVDGKTATLGISRYAANQLGDVVYVELPAEDTEVSAGDTIGSVESVKSVSDILTPITGVVVDTNKELEATPGTVNKDPEAGGWIAKIQIEGSSLEEEGGIKLMDAEEYQKFTEEPEADE